MQVPTSLSEKILPFTDGILLTINFSHHTGSHTFLSIPETVNSTISRQTSYVGNELSDKINETFVSVLKNYYPLSLEFRVHTEGDKTKKIR